MVNSLSILSKPKDDQELNHDLISAQLFIPMTIESTIIGCKYTY